MFDLMGFFITNFDIQTIYDAGWKASQAWIAAIGGVIMALSMMIRTVQEMANGSKADYAKAAKDFVTYSVMYAMFFFFVWLLIAFFNAIYGTVSASNAMQQLGATLNTVIDFWKRTEFEFGLRDLANGFYGGFAFVTFTISYMALVFVVFALRVAHAILVTLCAFIAAFAIPMAPVNGLPMLKGLKTMVITAIIWPIFDGFFMFLISSFFVSGLNGAFDTSASSISVGEMVFVLFVYSIINIFMAATAIAAAFTAQSVANGTGNVTGMLTSYAGAGIAAGAVAAKYTKDKANAAGAMAGKGAQKGWGGFQDGANKLGGMLNDQAGFSPKAAGGNARSILEKSGGIGAGAPTSSAASASGNDANTPQQSQGAGTASANESNTPQSSASSTSEQSSSASTQTNAASSTATTTTPSTFGSKAASGVADQANSGGASSNVAPTQGANSETTNASSSKAADSVAAQAQAGGDSSNTAPEKGASTNEATTGNVAAGAQAVSNSIGQDARDTALSEEIAAQASSENTDEGTLAEEAAAKSRKERQAQRGAIINQGRKK